jgi:predicted nucleotidyltransferase component of viral defense system
MNNAVKLMLDRYKCQSFHEYEQALREILQEIALVGLWRGKFFEHAAFYGDTALRIFYNLDRFSEDLDFTLFSPNPNWSWAPYSDALENEMNAFGFDVTFIEKKSVQSAVQSAFLKTPTVQEMLKIGVHSGMLKGVHPETVIRIKVEIDTEPTLSYGHEAKFLEQPVAVAIKCVNQECLFAGKMHAALFRAWKGRVKGRDWYDMVWFIRKQIPLNLTLFSQVMGRESVLTPAAFLDLAKARIEHLDVASAIEDCVNFVRDSQAIHASWSKEFFLYWIEKLQFT